MTRRPPRARPGQAAAPGAAHRQPASGRTRHAGPDVASLPPLHAYPPRTPSATHPPTKTPGPDCGQSQPCTKLTRKSQDACRPPSFGRPPRAPHWSALHLLAALVSQEGGIAAPLLRAAGAEPFCGAAATLEDQSPSAQAAGTTAARRTRRGGRCPCPWPPAYQSGPGRWAISTSRPSPAVGPGHRGGQAADVLRQRPVPSRNELASARSRRSAARPGHHGEPGLRPTRPWRSNGSAPDPARPVTVPLDPGHRPGRDIRRLIAGAGPAGAQDNHGAIV